MVVDSNILFSALIKDSITRKLILDSDLIVDFVFPEYMLEEFNKYKDVLIKKSGLTNEEFNEVFELILSNMFIVKKEELKKYAGRDFQIIGEIDEDDSQFVACALAYNAMIWSDDKKLKLQKEIPIINTKEFIDYFADNKFKN